MNIEQLYLFCPSSLLPQEPLKMPEKALQFYIFGNGIKHSMSPAIHNTGFKHYNLPHNYKIHEIDNIKQAQPFLQSPNFGGASVTAPYKVDVIQYLTGGVSETASIIGAVNTVLVDPETGLLTGDNTDWAGIKVSIEVNWTPGTPKTSAFVIGAGGAARAAVYALHSFGFETIYILNRTRSRAHTLKDSFPVEYGIQVLENIEGIKGKQPTVVIGNIPGDCQTREYVSEDIFQVPNGVLIEMAYKPLVTDLMKFAAAAYEGDKSSSSSWKVVTGKEVLLEQGYLQFAMWTGEETPKELMRAAVKL